jgi:hypothetical protein
MWIFSKSGFYSVVIDNQQPGRMLIRARCAADIQNLWDEHHETLKSMTEPTSGETRDYRWRLSLDKTDWMRLACRLAQAIDYSNFKSECHKRPDQANKTLVYSKVWQVLHDVQRETHGAIRDTDIVKLDDEVAEAEERGWQEFVARTASKPSTGERSDVVSKPAKRKTGKRKSAKKLF